MLKNINQLVGCIVVIDREPGDVVFCSSLTPDWSFSIRCISACAISPDSKISAAALIQRLSAEFIEARPVWKPMHLQPVFAHCKYFSHGNESVSEELFNRGIACLPVPT